MANKRLNATITIGGAISGSLRAAVGSTTAMMRGIGGTVRELEKRQRLLGESISTFGKLGKNVDALRAKYAATIKTVDQLRAAQKRLADHEKAVEANKAARKNYRSKIGEAAALGAAVVLPGAAAIKRSSDFNYELQAIGNTADMTRAQIGALGVEILSISDKAGKSAQDVQRAMGFLVAGGMDADVARRVLLPVGRTATATASEIEDVAKAAFTLNDAMKINPAQMQKALDILVQSGKEGNFEFKDMAAELPVLGAAFQALKMNGTEAAATLGAALQIARKGAGSSSQAATNMENFVAKVMSPETLKKAKKFGSDLYGVISKAQKKGENPFEAAIQEINRITNGGDQKLLGELFADMQVQSFLRPMLQNLEEYKRIKAKALGADGVVDRDFEKMAATSKQQMNDFGNAVGRAAIAVGDALEPALGRVLSVLTPIVKGVTEFVTANKELVGGTLLVVGGLTTLRLVTLSAGYAFTFLRGGMLATQGAFLRVGTMFTTLTATGTRVAGVMRAVAFAAALSAVPLGVVVGAAAGLAAVGVLVWKYWEPLKAFFVGFGQGLVAGLAPVGQAFNDAFAPVWNVIKPVVMPVLETVGGWVKSAIAWFGELLTPISAASDTTKAFGNAGQVCGEVVAKAFTVMLNPISLVVDAIRWINNNIGGVIEKAAAVGSAISGGWQAAKDFVTGGPSTPTMPQLRGAGAGGSGGGYTSQDTYHITQLPGESAEQLARRIAEINKRQAGVRARGNMTDGAQ